MASEEVLSHQVRPWLSAQSRPIPGTQANPQGRLFAPTGRYTGDPHRLHPENWLAGAEGTAHQDPIAWHSSFQETLPRYDDPESRAIETEVYEEDDEGEGYYNMETAVDARERPYADYGSAVGMHFGTLRSAHERSSGARAYIHPARIPSSTISHAPPGNFSTIGAHEQIYTGKMRSRRFGASEDYGEHPWSDVAVNYSELATDKIEEGKTLPYINEGEHKGSTSFRALPETVRTWSEDVLGARHPETGHTAGREGPDLEHGFRNRPHPAYVHLAEKGYNPTIMGAGARNFNRYSDPVQLHLPFGSPGDSPGEQYAHTTQWEAHSEAKARDAFQQRAFSGAQWTMHKENPRQRHSEWERQAAGEWA